MEPWIVQPVVQSLYGPCTLQSTLCKLPVRGSAFGIALITRQRSLFLLTKHYWSPERKQNVHQKSGENESYDPTAFALWEISRPRAAGGGNNLCNLDKEGAFLQDLRSLHKHVIVSVLDYLVYSIWKVTFRSASYSYLADLHAVACKGYVGHLAPSGMYVYTERFEVF